MIPIIAIVGRPGSGKSTLMRAIRAGYGQERDALVINDYHILREMFEEECRSGLVKFRARMEAGVSGFDVIDRRVFTTALCRVGNSVSQYLPVSKLIILEFARSDYADVRKSFRYDILSNTHFFFLETSLETCIQRLHKRVKDPCYPDDRLVSEETMRRNHKEDGLASLLAICNRERVNVINNEGAWYETWMKAKGFLDEILPQRIMPGRWSMANLSLVGSSFGVRQREPLPI